MRRGWVSDFAVSTVIALSGLALWAAGQQAGVATLSQDDGYVHMVVARNLVTHGTWGTVAGHPSGASSSPLFVLLLAGVSATTGLEGPAAATGLAAVGTLAGSLAAAWWLRRARWSAVARAALLVLIACIGRQVALVPTGLEHSLHAAAALVVVAALVVEAGGTMLFVLGAAAWASVWVRPEGTGMVVAVALAAVAIRRPRQGLALAAGGVLGWLGLASARLALGGGVIPATAPDAALVAATRQSGVAQAVAERVAANAPEGLTLAALGLVLPLWSALVWRNRGHLAAIPLVLVVLVAAQLMLGRVGNYFRYEAWLLVLGSVVALCGPAQQLWSTDGPRPVRGAAGLLTALVLLLGLGSGLQAIVTAHHSAAWQRESLGRLAEFVQSSGPDGPVASVSAGELAWRSGRIVVDISCRTTPEVTALCREGSRLPEAVDGVVAAYGARWAVLPASWVTPDLIPRSWVPVERWSLAHMSWQMDVVMLATSLQDAAEVAFLVAEGSTAQGVERDRLALPWQVSGGPAEVDASQGALYGNAVAVATARRSGQGVFLVWGTPAAGRGPRIAVDVEGEEHQAIEVGVEPVEINLGLLSEGATVTVRYEDDLVDASGNDRNLWLSTLRTL